MTRVHISYGSRRKPYNPQIGDRKETKAGVFRRVRRLAWGGGRNRQCLGTQVSGSRPLYDWIEEKYFTDKYEPGSYHNRNKEWWDEQERLYG